MKDPLTRAVRPITHRKKSAPLSKRVVWAYRALVIILTLMGVSTTASYFYFRTLQPSKGYTLEQLQVDQELLEADLRKLNQQATEARSFMNLKEEKIPESMAPISNEQTSFIQESDVAQIHMGNTRDQQTP